MCQYTLACQHFGVNPAVARHQVKCPVHNDSTASLSIARGKKVELVVHCHAGCLPKDIIAALDLPLPVHEMTTPEVPTTPSRIVAEYRYTNAEGETVAIKQRLDPKSFRWQSYDAAERRMRSGLPADGGQARIPLYRLPAVLEAAGKRLVMVCEGEKDCDALTAFGAVATCNPEGASGAASAYTTERWAALTRAHVVIFPDNDDPGRKHAQRIAEAIYPLAASVRVVALPDLPEKGDASDWLEKGGSLEALSAIIGEAKIWTPHPTEIVSLKPIVDPRRGGAGDDGGGEGDPYPLPVAERCVPSWWGTARVAVGVARGAGRVAGRGEDHHPPQLCGVCGVEGETGGDHLARNESR